MDRVPSRVERTTDIPVIVKVQQSIVSSQPKPTVLIYNRDRSFQYEGGLNQDMIDTLAGRPKAYFEAHLERTGLVIGEEVEEQPW